MSTDLTRHDDDGDGDDGFSGSLNSGRLLKGTLLKWTDVDHWTDRDGLTPPSPLLVVAIDEALQRWQDNKATVIRDKPLPDLETLNSSIPRSQWEKGIDGKLREPYAHIVVVYLVNLGTGEFYTFPSPTKGAHIAFEALKEAVITMRALRGTRVMPVVNLSERPFKTNFGMRRRPHFEIVGWKTPGEDQATLAKPATPQLSGPAVVAPQETPASPPASPPAPKPHQAKPKPPVNLTGETLAAMDEVKPVTMGEIINDELPW